MCSKLWVGGWVGVMLQRCQQPTPDSTSQMLARTTCALERHKSSGYAPAHTLRLMHLPSIFMYPSTVWWMYDGRLPGPE